MCTLLKSLPLKQFVRRLAVVANTDQLSAAAVMVCRAIFFSSTCENG
jgi:hypothetical protein